MRISRVVRPRQVATRQPPSFLGLGFGQTPMSSGARVLKVWYLYNAIFWKNHRILV